MTQKWLLAGLGNPGAKYQLNRHNVGFMLLDLVAKNLSSGSRPAWRKTDGAEFLTFHHQGIELVLLKPQEFMNNSGRAVVHYLNYANISSDHLIVAHDEVELPFGNLRLKLAGGHAGHNGIKSISAHLGSDSYFRLRLGVGRPENPNYDLANWVLANFSNAENSDLESFLTKGQSCVETLIASGLARAQALHNS